ncbi:hypothetical protein FHS18_001811 [Paenibacillus phyllosphaerae]|uniref:PELOTA RNA-binding domain-containing protein n=1 Tax=Paenibacillus phyllosphaerae TaxID=274593 RepID=A0A7W5AW18_9BACL|nr:cysteine protease StiP family protein [Paenibacillus phyllosphaerae]MBB3109748.1 hypothetical protein [Paenibacillus phyllosphaerae]
MTTVKRRLSERILQTPATIGSYRPEDVTFLLKDLSEVELELSTTAREQAIQSGVHYSEMLPIEYEPSEAYTKLFHEALLDSAERVAKAAAVTAELILAKRGRNLSLVSLARAGTPVGILIKRYLAHRHQLDVPHYSISIIRGKGIDQNALVYILQQHGADHELQFVDGWTGKGAIRKELIQACQAFEAQYGVRLNDDLAVLADPGSCSATFGTREDFLIPSACLNATVSGLVSRTVLREDLIGPDDFHGAKYYRELAAYDYSQYFVDTVCSYFPRIQEAADEEARRLLSNPPALTWQGHADMAAIQAEYGLSTINLVKPGVGETTRVLLRRIPWRILVDRIDNPNVRHIVQLTQERGVPVEAYPELSYSCCGIIQPLKGETE